MIKRKLNNFADRSSFTLVEALISIGIVIIISTLAFVNLASYKNKSSFDLDVQNVSEAIRTTQNRSINQESGLAWGIKFTNSTTTGNYYEIFSGTTYSTSSVIIKEPLSPVSQFTNPPVNFNKTILFSAVYGKPTNGSTSTPDSVSLKFNAGPTIATIYVNSQGKINVIKDDNLVGYWPMDELIGGATYDASKNSNDGTIAIGSGGSQSSTTQAWTAGTYGKFGASLNFDGTDDYVNNTNANVLQLTTGTESAWIKTSNAGSSYRGIVVKRSAYGLFLEDGVLIAYDWGASSDRTTGINLADGNWHHVAMTFQSGVTNGTILYIDGSAKATTTITVSSQANAVLTGAGATDSQMFNGQIDDVRIYNKILSPSDILNLHGSY